MEEDGKVAKVENGGQRGVIIDVEPGCDTDVTPSDADNDNLVQA